MSRVELITHHLGELLINQIEVASSICIIKDVRKMKAETSCGFKEKILLVEVDDN
jgi:hypothetical protein